MSLQEEPVKYSVEELIRYSEEDLIKAIDDSNLDGVKEILSNPTFKYDFISTALYAYGSTKFNIFKYLVSIDNMDNYHDDFGKNILLKFVTQPVNSYEFTECLSAILNNTKDINSIDMYNNTALFYATISYSRSKKIYVELSLVCCDMLVELLKHGSDPNIIGGNGNSAFMTAIDYDDIDLLKILHHNSIYGINDNVILRAISDNKYDFVEYLVPYVKDINIKIDGEKNIFLYVARTSGNINSDIIELLEMNGAHD